jgi:pilus assembly protein Flp/PilA
MVRRQVRFPPGESGRGVFEKGGRSVSGRNLVRRLAKDEQGAALIEYTVLLGLLIVAVLTTVIAVGHWVNGTWASLNNLLS